MSFSSAYANVANANTSRQALREQVKQRNEDLKMVGYSFENGEMQVRPNSQAEADQFAAKEAVQLARSLQGKLLAQETDKAFEDYAHTGDASYLQRALENNPELRNIWNARGVNMIGNLDFENDKDLLQKSGFIPTTYDTDEKKATLRKNLYKVYDGKNWNIGIANRAMAETGAHRRMGPRRAQMIDDNYREFINMMEGPKVSPDTAVGHKYEKQIMSASEKYDIPADLLASMIRQESSGQADAVSPKGAQGLMQIMPETAKELGVSDPMDPNQSIEGGAKYMRQLIDRYDGDLKKALAAYNAGMGNVDKYGGVPPFQETQEYVSNIMARLDNAGRYSNSSYDSVASTILEHRRAVANASRGLTNEQVDQGLELDKRKVAQEDRSLDLKQQANEIKLRTEGTTTTQKDLKAAENITRTMLEDFGGEDEFFNKDFSDPKEYRKAYQSIVKIEALEGTELSEADKKVVTDIRQLVALGDPAAKLTSSDTGLLDNTLGNMEKYISDTVDGVAAKSAYSAFRNSVRNALFGSALTEAEIKSFNEAYGTLGQQLGPVLEMFETSLSQVQAKLDSTANMMNPYSAKVRLGADQEKLLTIRDALQARIDYVKGIQRPEQRKPLDEHFGK